MKNPEPCCICGETAAGKYFGAVVCLPCKSFFIRCTKEARRPTMFSCSGKCDITRQNRLRCSGCRYRRCLGAGMMRKEKPEVVRVHAGQMLCRVCGDLANGIHFGVSTCEGCKKFFRRSQHEADTFQCKSNGKCVINPRSRNICRYCRHLKCLTVGMCREAIRMGRPKKASVKGHDGELSDPDIINIKSESADCDAELMDDGFVSDRLTMTPSSSDLTDDRLPCDIYPEPPTTDHSQTYVAMEIIDEEQSSPKFDPYHMYDPLYWGNVNVNNADRFTLEDASVVQRLSIIYAECQAALEYHALPGMDKYEGGEGGTWRVPELSMFEVVINKRVVRNLIYIMSKMPLVKGFKDIAIPDKLTCCRYGTFTFMLMLGAANNRQFSWPLHPTQNTSSSHQSISSPCPPVHPAIDSCVTYPSHYSSALPTQDSTIRQDLYICHSWDNACPPLHSPSLPEHLSSSPVRSTCPKVYCTSPTPASPCAGLPHPTVSTRTQPERILDNFNMDTGSMIQSWNLDHTESVLLSFLSIVASDWLMLVSTSRIEKVRQPIMDAFVAYMAGKNFGSLRRARFLLRQIPVLRDVTVRYTHHLETLEFSIEGNDFANVVQCLI